MVAYPQFYNSADSAQVTSAIPISQDAGTTWGPTVYHLWNDKGGSLGGSTLQNLRIVPKVFNGSSRVSSGYPILDEAWLQISVTGMDNTGDSTMEAQTTGYVPVGANNPLILSNIPANCARYLSVKVVVPAGAGNLTQELYLELVYDQSSMSLASGVGVALGPGVLPDFRDPTIRRLRRGRTITADGTAVVVVEKGAFVYDGLPYNVLAVSKTLNQTAADGALTVGQSYIARLSQKSDKTVTVTKGNKGASPTAPAVPSGEIDLGVVTVNYQGGGTSAIAGADVNQASVVYGEFLVTMQGLGVTAFVNVGAGTAVTSINTQPFSGSTAVVPLPYGTSPYATDWVWLRPDGTLTAIEDAYPPVPPTLGSLLLAQVLVDTGGVILDLVDYRSWSDQSRSREIVLSYLGEECIASGLGVAVADFNPSGQSISFAIESIDVVCRKEGIGAASNMKLDIKYDDGSGVGGPANWISLYTSSATDDQRPTGITERSVRYQDHEVNVFSIGRPTVDMTGLPVLFAFDIVAVDDVTLANDIFVIMHIRLL